MHRGLDAMRISLIRGVSLIMSTMFLLYAASARAGAVPLPSVMVQRVVCPVNGGVGPFTARVAPVRIKGLSAAVAKQLTYYASSDLGVLAPSGWSCSEASHLNGSFLLVTPRPHAARALIADGSAVRGPAVEVSLYRGNTSDAVYVASLVARLFPSARSFVDKVMREDIVPKQFFQFKPYPRDHLTRPAKDVVEYVTPAGDTGLGTGGTLAANALPIRGAVVLLPGPMNIVKVDVRLPADSRGTAWSIIRALEMDAANIGAGEAPGMSLKELKAFVKETTPQPKAGRVQANNSGSVDAGLN